MTLKDVSFIVIDNLGIELFIRFSSSHYIRFVSTGCFIPCKHTYIKF